MNKSNDQNHIFVHDMTVEKVYHDQKSIPYLCN